MRSDAAISVRGIALPTRLRKLNFVAYPRHLHANRGLEMKRRLCLDWQLRRGELVQ